MTKFFLSLLIFLMISVGYAEQSTQPLPIGKAFALTAYIDQNKQLILHWDIAPGYYLYKDKVHISAVDKTATKIGTIVLPKGQEKKDELHGVFQSYADSLVILVPFKQAPNKDQLNLQINYQGCSSDGFCYPPVSDRLVANLSEISKVGEISQYIVGERNEVSPPVSDQTYATRLLDGHSLFFIVIGFLGFGLLLAFTPCVLPMVPILSSIIVGYGNDISTKKAFCLSLAYVLGMAWSYANAGMLVALAGSRIQTELQNPWVIGIFCILFVILALSLFGLFEIRLPNKVHQRMVKWSHRHTGGTYVGVFFMGGFSTLVVSPCISAPLVGVLSYIADSGSVLLGGVALLSLGLGMGLPLLLIGTSAGKLLPRSGPWMHIIKQVFGFMMLGLAIWMLSRIASTNVTIYLWISLIVGIAIFIWRLEQSEKFWRRLNLILASVLLGYGFILLTSAVSGYSDPLNPFGKFSDESLRARSPFVVVKNMNQVDKQFIKAKLAKKQVILDFYADWCVSCIVMDKHVFNHPDIRRALNNYILLRADVTQNNAFDRELLKRFDVIAPPTIVFFDMDGNRLKQAQVVGEVNAKELLANVERADNTRKDRCKIQPNAC